MAMGKKNREVLSGFGPKKGEGRQLLSSVGKEDERLERWEGKGNDLVGCCGRRRRWGYGRRFFLFFKRGGAAAKKEKRV